MERELEILNKYLYETVKNDTHCNHCALNHEGICFFASECVKNNFHHFTNKKSLDNKK